MSGIIQRTFTVTAVVGLLLSSANSYANTGSGRYPRDADVLKGSKAPALEKIGDDVVRFSSTPALGGRGVVIELHRKDDRWATGTMSLLIGHPSYHWTTTATVILEINTSEYEALTQEIDAQLLRGEPPLVELENGDIVICTDGPGYVTERLKNGHNQWLSGFCGDHPNNRIAELMAGIAAPGFERWLPDFMRQKATAQ